MPNAHTATYVEMLDSAFKKLGKSYFSLNPRKKKPAELQQIKGLIDQLKADLQNNPATDPAATFNLMDPLLKSLAAQGFGDSPHTKALRENLIKDMVIAIKLSKEAYSRDQAFQNGTVPNQRIDAKADYPLDSLVKSLEEKMEKIFDVANSQFHVPLNLIDQFKNAYKEYSGLKTQLDLHIKLHPPSPAKIKEDLEALQRNLNTIVNISHNNPYTNNEALKKEIEDAKRLCELTLGCAEANSRLTEKEQATLSTNVVDDIRNNLSIGDNYSRTEFNSAGANTIILPRSGYEVVQTEDKNIYCAGKVLKQLQNNPEESKKYIQELGEQVEARRGSITHIRGVDYMTYRKMKTAQFHEHHALARQMEELLIEGYARGKGTNKNEPDNGVLTSDQKQILIENPQLKARAQARRAEIFNLREANTNARNAADAPRPRLQVGRAGGH